MGLRYHQLPVRLACGLDDRHLRSTNALALHLPKHVLDVARSRPLLLHPQREYGTPCHDRGLYLSF